MRVLELTRNSIDSIFATRLTDRQVPQEWLKNVRLVNKLWGPNAAAILFHTFTSDLRESGSARHDFDALLTSASGGFLDSVKVLHVRNTPQLPEDYRNLRALQLLGALPRGCLTSFTAEGEIGWRTLGLLIKWHPHLQHLSAPIVDHPNGIHERSPGLCYVAGNLGCITSLTIFSSADQAGYDDWFSHLTSLTTLVVEGRRPAYESTFLPWSTPNPLQKLRNLHLDDMHLRSSSGRLEQWVNPACLEKLTIRGCKNLSVFLQDLTVAFATVEDLSLKELNITSVVDETCVEAVDTLLRSISGIERINVSTTSAERVNVASLASHATSLRALLMDPLNHWNDERNYSEDPGHFYNVQELESLVTKCPNIEEFGVSLIYIYFGDWAHTRPFKWSNPTEQSAEEQRLMESLVSAPIVRFQQTLIIPRTSLPAYQSFEFCA